MNDVLVIRTGTPGTWREKLAGISAYARSENWQLQIFDARNARPSVEKLIAFWKPIGIIIDASGHLPVGSAAPSQWPPVVYMTPSTVVTHSPGIGVVSSDSGEISRLAAIELLRNQPKSIAFAGGGIHFAWATTKRDAFREIARINGMNTEILTSRHIAALEQLPRPVGIFAVTDTVAAELIGRLVRNGHRVPEEFSVVGVDDDPEICENTVPTLSSIRPDFRRLGFTAALLLKRLVNHPELPSRHLEVPPLGLVRRASSRIGSHYDPLVNRALEFIRLHACEGIGAKEVSAYLADAGRNGNHALSRRMLEIRFQNATGKTITDNLLDVRLSAACEYLRVETVSVAAIANFCGWKSDLAFRKAFKSRFGVPPLRWSKQHRIGG